MNMEGITASLSGFWIHQLSSSQAQGTGRGLYRSDKQATPPARFHPSSSCLLAGTTWFAWAKRPPWPSWTSCKFCHLLAYVYTVWCQKPSDPANSTGAMGPWGHADLSVGVRGCGSFVLIHEEPGNA